jgi:hypothetical protein
MLTQKLTTLKTITEKLKTRFLNTTFELSFNRNIPIEVQRDLREIERRLK